MLFQSHCSCGGFAFCTFMAVMHRYCYLLFIAMLAVASCGTPRHIRKANKKVERTAVRKNDGEFKKYTAESYISEYKDVAIQEMKRSGIPASITLAQGMLESGNGNSALARYANNHFGIKCTNDWDGRKYYKDDDKRNDCFRVYKNAAASFEDHTAFLKRKRYAALFELSSTDYKGWAKGLKKAGYATNPHYPQQLIELIERHELHRFDGRQKRSKHEEEHEAQDSMATEARSGSYIVKSGDTLYSIATRYGLTVKQLRRRNNLRGNAIHIGQRLSL